MNIRFFFLIHLCIVLKNDEIYTINISLLRVLYTVKIKKNCVKINNLFLYKYNYLHCSLKFLTDRILRVRNMFYPKTIKQNMLNMTCFKQTINQNLNMLKFNDLIN